MPADPRLITPQECFNSPYGTKYFGDYAESVPGPTTEALSAAAKANKVGKGQRRAAALRSLAIHSALLYPQQIYVIGGSIPERDGDKLYNTCPIFSPDGAMVATHRKVRTAAVLGALPPAKNE